MQQQADAQPGKQQRRATVEPSSMRNSTASAEAGACELRWIASGVVDQIRIKPK